MTFELKSSHRDKQKVYAFGSSKALNFIAKVLFCHSDINCEILNPCRIFWQYVIIWRPWQLNFSISAERRTRFPKSLQFMSKFTGNSSRCQESLQFIAEKHSYFYVRCLAFPLLRPLYLTVLSTRLIRISLFAHFEVQTPNSKSIF